MMAFIEVNKDEVVLEWGSVETYRKVFSDSLDESTICSADLSTPVILAEISPRNYALIDGHHRME